MNGNTIVASREYVHQVERIGGSDARLVFIADSDGTGPYCSWCWSPGGLCAHIAGGLSEHVQVDAASGMEDR